MKNKTNKLKKFLFLCFAISINICIFYIYPTTAQTSILPVEGSATWTSIGPGGGGAMTSIAIDPKDENIVYVGTDLGGIFKSIDGGQSFRAINNGLKNFVIQEIVINPVSPNIIYIGTEGGVYKSIDAGESWAIKRNGFPPISSGSLSAPVKGLAIDPNNTNVIYAGIGRSRGNRYFRDNYENFGCGQVYKSTDSGETWFKVNKPGTNNIDPFATIFEISVNPKNPNIIYAGGGDSPYHDEWLTKLYKSVDAGKNWKAIKDDLPSITVIAIDPSNPDIMYIGTGGSGVLKLFDPLLIEVNRYLNKGWNLISIPVQVADAKIDAVLKSINGDYESVWAFDNDWKQYNVNMPSWVNDLYTIEPGKGYWINMLRESTLKFIGKPIDGSVIYLQKGWNLVGYNSLVSNPIEIALSSINDNYDSVWAYDREYKAYSKNKPYNSLKIMRPGEGYWIKALDNCKWVYY